MKQGRSQCRASGCWHPPVKEGYCQFHYDKLKKRSMSDIYAE